MANYIRIGTYPLFQYSDLNTTTCYIRSGSWRTSPGSQKGLLVETFDIILRGTDAEIRAKSEELEKWVDVLYAHTTDPVEEFGLMFSMWSDDETSQSKASIVTDLSFSPVQDDPFTQELGRGAFFKSCVIEHYDIWFETSTSTSSHTGLSTLGGSVNKGGALGTADGIVPVCEIKSASAAYSLYDIWVGFKRLYWSDAAQEFSAFDPKQEFEAGSLVVGSLITDGNASPGGANNAVQINSVPSTLTRVWRGSITEANPSDYAYYKGTYLVLARVSINSGVVGMRLSYGPGAGETALPDAGIIHNNMVYVDNTITAYELVELGYLQIPAYGYGIDTGFGWADRGSWSLYVQQISGVTTDLRLDCYILMPSSNMIKATKCSNGVDDKTGFYQQEDGKTACINVKYSGANSYAGSIAEPTFTNWGWPRDGSIVVVAAQRSSGHILADTLSMTIVRSPAYRSFIP